MKKRIISIILAAAMVAALCVTLTACGAEKISLDDYVSITTEGYNGYGSAYTSFDSARFRADFKNVEFTSYGKEMYPYETTPVDTLLTYVAYDGSLDADNGTLSNGDEVTYTWGIGDVEKENLESIFDIKLNFDDIEFTVEGLEDAEVIDVFDGVTLTYTGTAPDGEAYIDVSNNIDSFDFDVEPSYGLSNGDIVTVSLNISVDTFIEEYGKAPLETSKEYTVDGLPYYATELSQIPDDALEKMKSQASDAFYASVASSYNSDYEDVSNFEFLGYYFLTPKEGFYGTNTIYLVYKVDMLLHGKNDDGSNNDWTYTYYTYYSFSNGMILPDGTFSISYADYGTCSHYVDVTVYDYTKNWSWNQETDLDFNGYEDLDTMFNQVVTSQIDEYTYENTVGADTAED